MALLDKPPPKVDPFGNAKSPGLFGYVPAERDRNSEFKARAALLGKPQVARPSKHKTYGEIRACLIARHNRLRAGQSVYSDDSESESDVSMTSSVRTKDSKEGVRYERSTFRDLVGRNVAVSASPDRAAPAPIDDIDADWALHDSSAVVVKESSVPGRGGGGRGDNDAPPYGHSFPQADDTHDDDDICVATEHEAMLVTKKGYQGAAGLLSRLDRANTITVVTKRAEVHDRDRASKRAYRRHRAASAQRRLALSDTRVRRQEMELNPLKLHEAVSEAVEVDRRDLAPSTITSEHRDVKAEYFAPRSPATRIESIQSELGVSGGKVSATFPRYATHDLARAFEKDTAAGAGVAAPRESGPIPNENVAHEYQQHLVEMKRKAEARAKERQAQNAAAAAEAEARDVLKRDLLKGVPDEESEHDDWSDSDTEVPADDEEWSVGGDPGDGSAEEKPSLVDLDAQAVEDHEVRVRSPAKSRPAATSSRGTGSGAHSPGSHGHRVPTPPNDDDESDHGATVPAPASPGDGVARTPASDGRRGLFDRAVEAGTDASAVGSNGSHRDDAASTPDGFSESVDGHDAAPTADPFRDGGDGGREAGAEVLVVGDVTLELPSGTEITVMAVEARAILAQVGGRVTAGQHCLDELDGDAAPLAGARDDGWGDGSELDSTAGEAEEKTHSVDQSDGTEDAAVVSLAASDGILAATSATEDTAGTAGDRDTATDGALSDVTIQTGSVTISAPASVSRPQSGASDVPGRIAKFRRTKSQVRRQAEVDVGPLTEHDAFEAAVPQLKLEANRHVNLLMLKQLALSEARTDVLKSREIIGSEQGAKWRDAYAAELRDSMSIADMRARMEQLKAQMLAHEAARPLLQARLQQMFVREAEINKAVTKWRMLYMTDITAAKAHAAKEAEDLEVAKRDLVEAKALYKAERKAHKKLIKFHSKCQPPIVRKKFEMADAFKEEEDDEDDGLDDW